MRIDAADGVLDGTLNMEMAHALAEKEAAAAAVAEGREEALPTTVVADGEALLPPPQKLPSPRALAETRQEASIADHDMEASGRSRIKERDQCRSWPSGKEALVEQRGSSRIQETNQCRSWPSGFTLSR